LTFHQIAPKILTPKMIDEAELVLTMGCSVEAVCPLPMLARMQKKLIDWHFENPKNKSIHDVRMIRDEIKGRVLELSKGNGRKE